MGEKHLRLFGFEVSFHAGGKKYVGESEEGNGTRKSLGKGMKLESLQGKPYLQREPSKRKLENSKYECQFCQRKFRNPHALGGHQNAHKKEKLTKRKVPRQSKSCSSKFTLEPPQCHSGPLDHCSLPYLDAFPTCARDSTQVKEFLISFKTMDQNQNFYCSVARNSNSIALPSYSYSHLEQGSHVIIKPYPSHVSKNCPSFYNQLGLDPPAISHSSRSG